MGKILIVDDVYADLQMFENALAPLGQQIITAMDGEEAEMKIKREKPDVVVLDVLLPGKSGFQVCRDVKSNDETKDIPIILISSKDQDSDKFWGKKQGADDYVTKPFDPEELRQTVARYLK